MIVEQQSPILERLEHKCFSRVVTRVMALMCRGDGSMRPIAFNFEGLILKGSQL
jgi:hypothetical protein